MALDKKVIDWSADFNMAGHNGHSGMAAALALGLRDFFIAKDGQEMAAALARLGFGMVEGEALLELEYDFNRLFVGPAAPAAPPWASVYLEKEPRLMGEAAIALKNLAGSLGLAAPAGMPEDWLPFELEFWLALLALEGDNSPAWLPEARNWLAMHMASWLPQFAARMRGAAQTPALVWASGRLEDWMKQALEQI